MLTAGLEDRPNTSRRIVLVEGEFGVFENELGTGLTGGFLTSAKMYAPNVKLDYTYNDKDDPNRFYYRSDHYNFAKNNIPIIFYFNGTHDDYHRPGDTPDKINYE